MSDGEKKKATGYDKYIDWKIFVIPVVLFALILIIPTPNGMKDVATEVKVGPGAVINLITQDLFQKKSGDADQWQLLTAEIIECNISMGALGKKAFDRADAKFLKKYKIQAESKNLDRSREWVNANLNADQYLKLTTKALQFKRDGLTYDGLKESDKKKATIGAWHIQVAIATTVFVVTCFLTECIPLPVVAFCTGLIFVFAGVVSRSDVAQLYWSDAVWFIMGSLMFAAAFIRTGVDKRVCLILFKGIAVPSVRLITLGFFIVITPLAAFISDHALAAMFLPIGMLLYQNSLTDEIQEDPELAKMLMISIAMACNIGGPGAPSGGARNVIMMTYLNDMFGMDIGYYQWMTYCMPFLVLMIPVTWFFVNWRFKPKVTSLAPAMDQLKREIARMGGWNSKQIWALVIFVVMVFGWITEQSFYESGIIPVRLGIGVLAMAGAVAYVLAGVVNWRDYHQRVDWGVVWLYAGALIYGRVLDSTGAAYWLARSVMDLLAPLGMSHGIPLLVTSNGLTALMTQLMADGPCAAAVGPVVLNMAGLAHPGSSFLPFVAMSTGIAASFAYCLIIGTPPNAIVYASGYLEPKDFLRVGVPLWIAANVVLGLMAQFYWVFRGWSGLPGF